MGNGSLIRIWKDNWLPFTPGLKPHTPRLDWDENDKVESLIDSQTKQWIWEIHHEMFSSIEALNISKIPINDLAHNMWLYGI